MGIRTMRLSRILHPETNQSGKLKDPSGLIIQNSVVMIGAVATVVGLFLSDSAGKWVVLLILDLHRIFLFRALV